jgi:IS5 family transposase
MGDHHEQGWAVQTHFTLESARPSRLISCWTRLSPKKATLQQSISAISDVTWEQINLRLLGSAKDSKVEKGEMLRIDSTVTDSPIHEPSDSTLLWDSVRVLVRLLKEAEALVGAPGVIGYHNHQRVAKKRVRAIRYTRGVENKARLYKDLIDVTRKTLKYVEQASVRHYVANAHSEKSAI